MMRNYERLRAVKHNRYPFRQVGVAQGFDYHCGALFISKINYKMREGN